MAASPAPLSDWLAVAARVGARPPTADQGYMTDGLRISSGALVEWRLSLPEANSGATRPSAARATARQRNVPLKIDGEFVSGCLGDRTDQLVIEAVVRIARGLGKEAVAEFVSHPQLEDLRAFAGRRPRPGLPLGRPVLARPDLRNRPAVRVS